MALKKLMGSTSSLYRSRLIEYVGWVEATAKTQPILVAIVEMGRLIYRLPIIESNKGGQ